MVSGTTTDWQQPESSTKQADPLTDKDAANASTGGSRDPQPSTRSERTREGSRAADAENVIDNIGLNPAASSQLAPANAPATLGGGEPMTDGPAESPTIHEQQAVLDANELDDVLSAERRVVLILVGLVGSGKSTFAQALERHYPQFRRCNQDELGDRRSVEALARQSLREGHSVVIDRTNFDESQRATWIRIASEVPAYTPVWIIVFDTPYEVCAERLRNRTDHPTITTPERGLEVLERFQSQFRPPLPHEGYSRILYLKPADLPPTPELNAEDVQSVLRRLQATPEIVRADPAMHDRPYSGYGWRGHGDYNRGYRGDQGSYQPRRGFPPRGTPAYRGDWAPRGGYRGRSRGQGTPYWDTRARGSGSFGAPDGGGSSSGWRGRSSTSGGSSGESYPSHSGRDVSVYDRTEHDWRR